MSNGEQEANLTEALQAPEAKKGNGKTKAGIQAALERFKANKGEVQSLPSGTEADAVRAAQSPVHAEAKPERIVEPHTFTNVLKTVQAGITCYTVGMTFQQVVDYCTTASDLPYGDDGVAFKYANMMDKWQRKLDSGRVTAAANYLLNSDKYIFPGLLCVPVNGTYNILREMVNEAGYQEITLTKDAIAYIDGQHRGSGIFQALNDPKGSRLSNDTIPVSIIVIAPTDVNLKQQLFSDVNMNPKKASKADAIAFDHRDPAIQLAKQVSESLSGNNTAGHQTLVDWSRTSAKKKVKESESPAAMTLVNVLNMIKPAKGATSLTTKLNQEQLTETVKAVVENLPDIDKIRSGVMSLGDVQKIHVWPYSAIYQGLGQCLNDMVDRSKTDGSGEPEYSAESFASVVNDRLSNMRHRGMWRHDYEIERNGQFTKIWETEGVVQFTAKGAVKVGSRADDVKSVVRVLRTLGLS